MMFAWDPSKARRNETKHGVAFEFAGRVFDDTAHVDGDASREQNGENRRKAIGRIDGKLYSVVYTIRGSVIWIISARRTNPKEDRQYGDVRP